ncbi:MAG: AAA domain-containing protein [Pseudomonadota bacterium]
MNMSPWPATHPYAALLARLVAFVEQERDIAKARCLESWARPMKEKIGSGMAQQFVSLEVDDDPKILIASLGRGESRFREGDQLCLHAGSALSGGAVYSVVFEFEGARFWKLRCRSSADARAVQALGVAYGEQDLVNLSHLFLQSLTEIAMSADSGHTVLALIDGTLPTHFNAQDYGSAYSYAVQQGLNGLQAEAVGKALSADHVACIQGPPGTGKTRVLALAAALLVARGERVLVTSHTHAAINNALNKIAPYGVPIVKIGGLAHTRGLEDQVERLENISEWENKPIGGFIVGATPFASCSKRLAGWDFDTIIFDEASQVTVPLALMAMRVGKRFVFIGDQQQLPPVVLSQSILGGTASVFSHLTSHNKDSVMLRETYRMNRWLTAWPSRNFYNLELHAAGPNAERRMLVAPVGNTFASRLLALPDSAIFVPTRDRKARSRNQSDAALVLALCRAAHDCGLALADIGIVTPYRAQGRAIRSLLRKEFGERARELVADTVERMQGQERELVILSLATGDLGYLANVAEFFFQRERLNVSVTRAMTKLVIIGPEVPAWFSCSDEQVAANVALYRDMIACCRQIDPEGSGPVLAPVLAPTFS